MSFRIEEKLKLTKYEESILLDKILSMGARSIYSERIIQSIYFDNIQLQSFVEAEEGVLPRKKIRIRDYPEKQNIDYGNAFFLEKKTSSIEGRFKVVKKISESEKNSYIKNFYFDTMYGVVKPILIVRYFRKYFLLNNIRFTLDNRIKYISIDKKIIKNEKLSVVELKTEINTNRDFIESIFPYPRSRFSKYCNGIISLGLDNENLFQNII